MRGLATCLLAGALVVAGCGSSGGGSTGAQAPKSGSVATSSGSAQSVAVSAHGRPTPKTLCTAEGTGKPHGQCVKGLTKLDKGKAKNPAAACKGLSKKKTKGVKGKSPYAVCVSAAAKLMASKNPKSGSGNGSADSSGNGNGKGGGGSGTDTSSSDSSDSSAFDCVDADGNPVPIDSPDVDSCSDSSDSSDAGAQDSSSDSSDSSGDSSDSSGDSSNGP